MVIFELDVKQAKKVFSEIQKILKAAKYWKLTTRIEITVLDGAIQLVGPGFVRNLDALTTGSCKLVVSALQWFDFIQSSQEKLLKVVVTEGEAMVGRVSVRVNTTFFETDKILRSIQLPVNPKAIDYWKLEYQSYTPDELQFNGVDSKIIQAKKDFEESIRLAAMNLSQFRISKQELKEMVLERIREREKIDFQV